MYKNIALLFSVVLLFGACNSIKTEKFTIASQMGDCIGVAPMKCLLVKKEGQTDWEFFYSTIEGFDYEPGYEYVLEVKVENVESPVADRSMLKYVFVKEISKKQKTSENLPWIPVKDDTVFDVIE